MTVLNNAALGNGERTAVLFMSEIHLPDRRIVP